MPNRELQKIAALVGVAALLPMDAAAQSGKTVAHAESYWIPGLQLIKGPAVRAEALGAGAGFAVPLSLRKGIYLTPKVNYHLDAFAFDDPQEPAVALHAIDLKLALKAKLSQQWGLKLSVGLGIAGDLTAVDSGLLRGHGSALATYAFSDELSLGAGVYASYKFGSFFPLPAVALIWRPSAAFTMDMYLPDHVTATYHVHPRIDLSMLVSVAGQKYGIRSDDRCFPDESNQIECVDHIAFSFVTLEAVASFRAISSLWLIPYLGTTLYRRFEMFTAEKKRTGFEDDRLANGPFLGLRAEWRLPQ